MHFRTTRVDAVVGFALLLALSLATAGCGGDDDDDGPATATGRFGQVHTGVCAAAQFSEDGDRKRAEESFDDVHFGLHALVQAVEPEDRAAAARLLESIERAESQGSTESLRDLSGRVGESIERTGGTAPETCP